ncbi:ABC transporter substrate-binding protein [Paenibacillus sp. IB182496]|uniref:ABC transporter substrate-binding protein n=1 Tax=Paenibacillus sabuli TaxID=2772509 RepID=A0A927BQW2_9BACL|nr:ABC transporter substrate-binding protein [Paenibacillus sabuli]MBD2844045.1 ABC transporter substrate-binding protein [Paenibacillus sabuli]
MGMKNRNRALRMASALLMATAIAGCSSNNDAGPGTRDSNHGNNAASNAASSGQGDNQQAIALTYWAPLPADVGTVVKNFNEITMYKVRNEESHVNVKFEHPAAGSEDEQFNLMMASQELPDVIEYDFLNKYPGGPDKAIEDGVIIPLNDLIDEYAPNLKSYLEEHPDHAKEIKTDSGTIYNIPSLSDSTYRSFGGPMMRKDWLDEYHLSLPETVDDWENILTVLKQEKGLDAPYAKLQWMPDVFAWAYGIQVFDDQGFYQNNGTVLYGPMQPEYKAYLTRMHSWYEDGLLDPDFSTIDQKTMDAKVLQEEAAGIYGYIGGGMGQYNPAGKEKNENFNLVAVQYPVLKQGDEPQFINAAAIYQPGNSAYLTSANENPVETVQWFDYWFSEEGQLLKSFGVEGQTYTMVGDYPTYTDEILDNPEGLSIALAMSKHMRTNKPAPGIQNLPAYLEQYYQMDQQKEAVQIFGKYADNNVQNALPKGLVPTADEAKEMAKLNANIQTYVKEMYTKFIMGAESLDRFDEYLATLNQLDVDRLTELKQNQLDRYQVR